MMVAIRRDPRCSHRDLNPFSIARRDVFSLSVIAPEQFSIFQNPPRTSRHPTSLSTVISLPFIVLCVLGIVELLALLACLGLLEKRNTANNSRVPHRGPWRSSSNRTS